MNVFGVEANAKEIAIVALFGAGVVWGVKTFILAPAAEAVVDTAAKVGEEVNEYFTDLNHPANKGDDLFDMTHDQNGNPTGWVGKTLDWFLL